MLPSTRASATVTMTLRTSAWTISTWPSAECWKKSGRAAAQHLLIRGIAAAWRLYRATISVSAFAFGRWQMKPTQEEQAVAEQLQAGFATPPLPTTSSEFITALAHYHRAEIA